MLDEMFQQNASKCAIFYIYKKPIDQGNYQGKNKVARNEKRKKLHGFSYYKSVANFEAFCWNISSSINLLLLKSLVILQQIRNSDFFSTFFGSISVRFCLKKINFQMQQPPEFSIFQLKNLQKNYLSKSLFPKCCSGTFF